jgi:hypothetical protein
METFAVNEGVVMAYYYMGVYGHAPESVGRKYPPKLYEVFISGRRPIKELYGDVYGYVIGPFKSRADIEEYVSKQGGNFIERPRKRSNNPSFMSPRSKRRVEKKYWVYLWYDHKRRLKFSAKDCLDCVPPDVIEIKGVYAFNMREAKKKAGLLMLRNEFLREYHGFIAEHIGKLM